jgi:hypothetical protein
VGERDPARLALVVADEHDLPAHPGDAADRVQRGLAARALDVEPFLAGLHRDPHAASSNTTMAVPRGRGC